MTLDLVALRTLVVLVVGAPLALVALLGVTSLGGRPLGERTTMAATRTAMAVAFVATAVAGLIYLGSGAAPQRISFGAWFSVGHGGFEVDFLLDGFALGFATLSAGICGIVAAFSHRYLHRQPGYNRYFVLFAVFASGLMLVSLAGSIEVLFAGWEFLGLSSALLVAFFHTRPGPVSNALRIFVVYRISDAALLTAAALLHYWAGSGSLHLLFSAQTPAPDLGASEATIIGVLLIAAVAGKSALLPFSTWLPRAMEGPTPSSAVYYGALSVHAGCFLLLRAEPLIAQSSTAQVLALLAGVTTALFAASAARVQTDIKSALAYSSLTQVGIIVTEIALGWTTLAFLHIVGHACFRLLQLLAAPNVLHDVHELERAVGGRSKSPNVTRSGAYLLALEAGFLDGLLERLVLAPFRRLLGALNWLDAMLCASPKSLQRRPGALDD